MANLEEEKYLSNLGEENYLTNLGGAIVICNGFLHSQDVVDCLLQNFHLSSIKNESSAHQQQISHIESNHNEKSKLTKLLNIEKYDADDDDDDDDDDDEDDDDLADPLSSPRLKRHRPPQLDKGRVDGLDSKPNLNNLSFLLGGWGWDLT